MESLCIANLKIRCSVLVFDIHGIV